MFYPSLLLHKIQQSMERSDPDCIALIHKALAYKKHAFLHHQKFTTQAYGPFTQSFNCAQICAIFGDVLGLLKLCQEHPTYLLETTTEHQRNIFHLLFLNHKYLYIMYQKPQLRAVILNALQMLYPMAEQTHAHLLTQKDSDGLTPIDYLSDNDALVVAQYLIPYIPDLTVPVLLTEHPMMDQDLSKTSEMKRPLSFAQHFLIQLHTSSFRFNSRSIDYPLLNQNLMQLPLRAQHAFLDFYPPSGISKKSWKHFLFHHSTLSSFFQHVHLQQTLASPKGNTSAVSCSKKNYKIL